MRDFQELLTTPNLGRVIAAQLVARFPAGMFSLGVLMHVEHVQGNYTSAGLVLAVFSIGMAVAGPIVSRQLSTFGTTRVLLVTLLVSATSFTLFAAVPLPLLAQLVLAFIGGATIPPVIPTVRTLYPQLAPPRLLNGLFSLDAALQEVIWVIGPVLITLLVSLFGTGPALLAVAGIQLIGGLLFTLDRSVRALRIPPTERRFGNVMRNSSVALMVTVSLLMIASLSAVEASMVGTFGEGSLQAGGVLAICSAGSLVGGLLVGNRVITRWSLALRLLVVVVGLGIASLSSGFVALSVALLIAGIGIAPALAAVSSITTGSVSLGDTAEAYGWIGTGQLLGAALGSALAGIAIDAAGGQGGVAVSALLGVVAMTVAAVFRRAQPDLTGDAPANRSL